MVVVVLCSTFAKAQSIPYSTIGSVYYQSFDSLKDNATVIAATSLGSAGPIHLSSNATLGTAKGWFASRNAGSNANALGSVDDGNNNSGAVRSLGIFSNTNKCLGSLASGSTSPRIGAIFKNTTGSTLTNVSIAYLAKQFRLASALGVQNLFFSYQIMASAPSINATGTWTSVSNLDCITTINSAANSKINGNISTNQTPIGYTISGLSWTSGSFLVIRWDDIDDTGSDATMGVDSFRISASNTCSAPISPSYNVVTSGISNDQVVLTWANGGGSNVLVTAKQGSAPTTTPTNNTTYSANSAFTACVACTTATGEKVVYNGSGNTVTVSGLSASTGYFFRIYDYNCSAGSEQYLTSSFASTNATTTAGCTAPTTQPTGFSFTQITKTSMKINMTAGNGAKRLVIVRLGSTAPSDPTNNTSYTADPTFANGSNLGSNSYVVYNGTGNNVTITGLSANSLYTFKIVEYNCSPGNEKYASVNAPTVQSRTAGNFVPGGLVVSRVGNGVYYNTTAEVFIDEYDQYSKKVRQSISMPLTSSGAGNYRLTVSQSATSELALAKSNDGKYLTVAGYDAGEGNSAARNQTSAIAPRTVGIVDQSGAATVTTAFSDGFDGNNIRAAVTDNGTNIWAVGTASATTAAGVRTKAVGSGTSNTSTQLNGTYTNLGNVRIFNGQLYVTGTGNLTATDIAKVGSGMPTASGQSFTNFGLPVVTGLVPASFVLLDASETVSGYDLCYVADASTTATGGIYKFSYNGSTWSAQGKILLSNTSYSIAGFTAKILQNNSVELYFGVDLTPSGYTSGVIDNTNLIRCVDNTAYTSTMTLGNIYSGTTLQTGYTLYATSAFHTKYRGIEYSPIENVYATTGTVNISGSDYNNITVYSGATLNVNADFRLHGTIRVKTGGTINFNGFTADGWSCGNRTVFAVETGATIETKKAAGFSIGNTSAVHTSVYNIDNNITVIYDGSSAQITGSLIGTVNTLIVNNSAGVSATKNITIQTNLQVLNGTYNATPSGSLYTTLISNSTSTARIDQLASGAAVSGTFKVQRYLGTDTGWAYLSTPINGNSLADWNAPSSSSFGITMFGFTGVANGTKPSIYTYDETQAGLQTVGFTAPTGVYSSMTTGLGYITRVLASGKTLVNKGTPNQGNISLPVTFTSTSGGTSEDGWNMVGNPYPAPINWSNGGVTKTNVDSTIYIWNANTSSYATWNGSTGTNGGSKNIALGQAFYVHANASSPSIAVTESAKTTTTPTFFAKKSASNMLSIKLIDGANHSDEAIINFNDNATKGFDANLDAYKLDGYNLNVTSKNINGTRLAFNAMPLEGGLNIIPLTVSSKSEGTHRLAIAGVESIDKNLTLFLEDLTANTRTKITADIKLEITVDGNANRYRILAFNSNTSKVDNNGKSVNVISAYPNPIANNELNIINPTTEVMNITIMDMTGKVMSQDVYTGGMKTTIPFNFPIGVYNVIVKSSSNVQTIKVVKQ